MYACIIIVLNYRLAPENPYPSALVDVLACYLWLTDTAPQGARYHHEQVVIGGDSAGKKYLIKSM
jgi:acetyl esterase/lipase